MTYTVRQARPEDAAGIGAWTQDTFEWGDYVAESLPLWIDDESLHVLVAVDSDDTPRATSVVRMLSADEGWLSAARVHPDAQRRGLGSMLNRASVDWAREQGGRVVRLATEDTNIAAQAQVEKLGYRKTSTWVFAVIEGRAADQPVKIERLSIAGRSDVDPAWMYWSTGELCEAGRGLKASAWTWRRANVEDLEVASREHRLFNHPAGWAMVEYPTSDEIDIVWIASSPNDFPRLIASVDHLAVERDAVRVTYRIPQTGWSGEALRRAGATVSETLVYTKAV
jgi:GNAT superfamily N-acetyltransferase